MDYTEWSPQQDVHLQSDGYQNYSQANLREGKAKCKEALQRVWCMSMLCVVDLMRYDLFTVLVIVTYTIICLHCS